MSNNCYNPGMDLVVSDSNACVKLECIKKYDQTCMYNAQGQYICNFRDGYEYVMSVSNPSLK